MNGFAWATRELNWTEELIDLHREHFREGKLAGSYGLQTVLDMERHMKEHMADVITGEIFLHFKLLKTL